MNKALTVALIAVLAFSVFLAAYLYIQAQNASQSLPRTNYETSFYNEFGVLPTSNFAYSFAPPVSMYQATRIGLESEGWNKTSLTGLTVSAHFVYASTATGYPNGPSGIVRVVTTPPANYSSDSMFGACYQYAWAVSVKNSTNPFLKPIAGFTLVDAQTGTLLPRPEPPTETPATETLSNVASVYELLLVIIVIVAVLATAAGALVYFKKRKKQKVLN